MPLAAGARFGAHEIVALLGAGGMGEVWRARDTRLDREVALKVLPPATLDDETARARLLREARLASKLNHPHVCTIHEVGEAEGRPFVAMELVEGCSLSKLLSQGPLPIEQVLRLGQQLADALAHAHEHGVVHRDFKTANVVLTPEGRAKVLDFGLAKRLAGEEATEATTASYGSLTAPGTLAGTLAYMAPEQLRGQAADARSDSWALGVVLYEMVSGRRPFHGQTGFALSSAILNDSPPALPTGLPDGLRGVVERCLEKEPARRYQRAAEVRAVLEALASGATVPPARAPARRSPRQLGLAAGLVVLAAMLTVAITLDLGGVRRRLTPRLGSPARSIRLAVLPFANLSGDPGQEYFSDGVTQEMIAQLGRLHPQSLSVIARTSVMRYKKTETPIDQIGRELDVDYVLEGSARREGSRVRVSAELIKVNDQSQLWADSLDREMAGILALQSDVARKVANALALELLPGEKTRLASTRAVDPEAHEAYLRGSYQWMKFVTPGDLDTAEKYFDLALEKDPSYAPAYAGRAWIWIVRNQWGWSPPEEGGPKAKAAALRAIELDENCAGAYEALAIVRMGVDWDWDGAWESWRRSLETNPNVASAQGAYAHFLMIMGHSDEARIHSERAVALDPFNPLIRSWHAFILYSQRRYDEAIAEAREALRYQPDFPVATNALWFALHEKKGMEKEALEAARAFARITYDDPRIDAALSEGYAQGGYAEAMKRGAEALIARLPETFCLPSDIAAFYMMAGEDNKAVDWLEKGLKIHDPVLPYLGPARYPLIDPLRSEPRFQVLLRKVGLPTMQQPATPRAAGAHG
jgi:serine/threonine protein kinase/tetratricopeptide (TPR) repeat protein